MHVNTLTLHIILLISVFNIHYSKQSSAFLHCPHSINDLVSLCDEETLKT